VFISLGVSVGYWTADVFVPMLEDVRPDPFTCYENHPIEG
jgi:hypothetical protein